jgi:hypothetical protein
VRSPPISWSGLQFVERDSVSNKVFTRTNVAFLDQNKRSTPPRSTIFPFSLSDLIDQMVMAVKGNQILHGTWFVLIRSPWSKRRNNLWQEETDLEKICTDYDWAQSQKQPSAMASIAVGQIATPPDVLALRRRLKMQ